MSVVFAFVVVVIGADMFGCRYSIIITAKDGLRVVKYTDFGLAIKAQDLTPAEYGIAGTPGYMSPECEAGKSYSSKTDVWSLSVSFSQVRLFLLLPVQVEPIFLTRVSLFSLALSCMRTRHSKKVKRVHLWRHAAVTQTSQQISSHRI